jgi:DNA-binding response OmpR family regulator
MNKLGADMMARAKMLLVEDDAALAELLVYHFRREDFDVKQTADGEEALLLAQENAPDIVLLDWMIEGLSGIEVCRRLRRMPETQNVPIIMLTARGEEEDRVRGLETGADDYVTKPFSPRELLARVRAVLRRYQVQATLPERDNTRRAFRFSGWELNLRTRRLSAPTGDSVELSNGEFSLLAALCRAPRRVLSRDQLLSMSRLHEAEVYDRTIDVQIRRLRLKLEADAGNPALILTERGAGYLLASDVESLY